MWASIIIGTSFAPSPTAIVIQGPFFFARATMSAFYLGEALQTMTELALQPNLIKTVASTSSVRTWFSVMPSITKVIFLPSRGNSLKASLKRMTNSVLVFAVRMIMSISSRLIRLQDLAISMAVSYLSPVSTHNLMFASIRCLMVWGTSSWSLSSMAVLPRKVSSCSNSSYSSFSLSCF